MSRLIRAVIDTNALRSNLARVRDVAAGARVMAVIKANGYGHGLVPVALALADADALAVARLEEGVQLREAGVRNTIVLLEGVFSAEQLSEAAQRGFDIVVHTAKQIDLLEDSPDPCAFTIWVKVDTGMNRLGFRPEEFRPAMDRLCALPVDRSQLRLVTHLARADEPQSTETLAQVARFEAATSGFDYPRSIGNSAGLFGWPSARGDWVRPGLALFGVSPFADRSAADLGLVPAMTLETTVIAVRRVPKGEAIGYGGAWCAPRDSVVAVLAAGYGDGLLRTLATGTPVLMNGRRAPLVGRVSMDMVTVDATEVAGVQVGCKAVLWGAGLPVEEVASHAGTIPYELLCGVRARVPRELR